MKNKKRKRTSEQYLKRSRIVNHTVESFQNQVRRLIKLLISTTYFEIDEIYACMCLVCTHLRFLFVGYPVFFLSVCALTSLTADTRGYNNGILINRFWFIFFALDAVCIIYSINKPMHHDWCLTI